MTKKRKFLVGILTALSVCSMAFALTSCGNPVDKVENFVDQLFCEHEWNDGEVTKESTCTEKGELTKTCTLCDKEKVEYLELKKHVGVYVESVAPTCTENGKTDGVVCSVCETVISGVDYIPALGHVVVEDVAVEKTCLEDGLTRGEHCARCEEVLIPQSIVRATGHKLVAVDEVAATCEHAGHTSGVRCEFCDLSYGIVEIPMLEHKSFEEDGFTCKDCGNADGARLDTANHTDVSVGTSLTEGGWFMNDYTSGISFIAQVKFSGDDEGRATCFGINYDEESESFYFTGYAYNSNGDMVKYATTTFEFKVVEYGGYPYFYISGLSFDVTFEDGTTGVVNGMPWELTNGVYKIG